RFLPVRPHGEDHLHLAAVGIHPAGDLLANRADQARVPGRGASRSEPTGADPDQARARHARHRGAPVATVAGMGPPCRSASTSMTWSSATARAPSSTM